MKNSKRYLHSIIQECLTRILTEAYTPRDYWDDYERCKAEASKYKSSRAFRLGNKDAWQSAVMHGWLDEFFRKPLKKPSGYWDNYNICKEEASKYKGRNEFRIMNSAAYKSALNHGWLDEFFGELSRKPNGYWDDYEHCKAEASKYKSRGEFSKGNFSAWDSARIYGWLDEFFRESFKKPKGYWNDYERCKAKASKYKGRKEFHKGNHSAYRAARNHGWLDEFFGKSLKKPRGYWNDYERCKAEASKYKNRGEFGKGDISAWQSAQRHGWLDEFFPKKKRKRLNRI